MTVELIVNGASVSSARADRLREDLVHAGCGDGRHAFEIAVSTTYPAHAVKVRVKGSDFYLMNNADKAAKRHFERLNNSVLDGLPRLKCGFTSRDADKRDEVNALELITHWRILTSALGHSSPRKGEIWDLLIDQNHREFVKLMDSGDGRVAAEYLSSLARQSAGYGVLQGYEAYLDLVATSDEGRNSAAIHHYDMLVSLAQYIGLARLETPEQGASGRLMLTDQEVIGAAIEDAISVSLAPPAIFDGLFGLRIRGGIVEQRSLQALYAALRAKALAGVTRARICEIGAGFAQVAYYAGQLGIRHYTIVDLPSMVLMQLYFLRRALPDVNVSFIYDGGAIPTEDGIYLVTAASFPARASETYDLVLNCDSFPEMGEDICRSYFDVVRERSPLLLSINQEANCPLSPDPNGARQPVVGEMLAKRSDYSRVYRFRTWIRKGYAEELWRTTCSVSAERALRSADVPTESPSVGLADSVSLPADVGLPLAGLDTHLSFEKTSVNDPAELQQEKLGELQQTLASVEAELIAIVRRKEQAIEALESMPAVRLTRYLHRRRRSLKRALRSAGLHR